MYYRVRSRTGEPVKFDGDDDDIELAGDDYMELFCDLSDIDRKKFVVQTLRFQIFDDCPECPTGWIDYDPDECCCDECGFVPDWVYVARRWRWSPALSGN